MSRTITTLKDLKHDETHKIKTTISTLTKQITSLKIDEFKNARYITALENQIRELATQLKEVKQTPKLDLTSILKEINEDTQKKNGMTDLEIKAMDKQITQKIKNLMS